MTLEVLIPLGIAIAITAVSAVTDTRTGHIPNWITFPPILLAPIGYGLFFGWYGFGQSVLGLLACGVVPYFMFWQGGMGGGDVKLFAALGALLGWQLGIEIELASMILGALFAMIKLARRGRIVQLFQNSFFLVVNPFLPKGSRKDIQREEADSLRLGAAIFAGTLSIVLWRFREAFLA